MAGKAIAVNPSLKIESTLQVGWPLPLALVIVTYAGFLALVVWLYWNERGRIALPMRLLMATLRFALLVLVVWMLAGWRLLRERTELPELVIALDLSESMKTVDQAESVNPSAFGARFTQADGSDVQAITGNTVARSRLEQAYQLINLDAAKLKKLREQYQVRLYAVADQAVPIEISAEGIQVQDIAKLQDVKGLPIDVQHSRLGDSLNRILERQAGRSTAAVVWLSDGINTTGASLAEAAQQARVAAIPIHAITLGSQTSRPDVRITDLLCESQVFLGDRVTIDVTAGGTEVSNQSVPIRLLDESGSVLSQKSVQFSGGQSQQKIQLEFVPKQAGELKLKVLLDPITGESNLTNTAAEHLLVVENRTIRVLLVFGTASYEFRFLKHFLERTQEGQQGSAASFELKSVLQNGDLEYVMQDSSAQRFVPSDALSLTQFDAFIFGAFDPTILPRSSQQAIVKAVTQSGAGAMFVLAEGSLLQRLSGMPLAELLPVNLVQSDTIVDRFDVAATKLGEAALPLQLSNIGGAESSTSAIGILPRLETLLKLSGLKPGAQVLAEAVGTSGAKYPLLVSQFAGAGRTVLLATDETYRWTGVLGSDSIHQAFWGQTLRWISRGKLSSRDQAELSVDPKQSLVGTPIRLRLRLPTTTALPEEANLRITAADGSILDEKLTRITGTANNYQGLVSRLPAGSYRAVLTQPSLAIPPAVDFSIVAPPGEQANLRADIVAMEGLATQSRGRHYVGDSAQRWYDALPPGQATRLGSLPPLPIWNNTWVAALFVLLITAEWLLRRYARML